jgi:hypothetical protein
MRGNFGEAASRITPPRRFPRFSRDDHTTGDHFSRTPHTMNHPDLSIPMNSEVEAPKRVRTTKRGTTSKPIKIRLDDHAHQRIASINDFLEKDHQQRYSASVVVRLALFMLSKSFGGDPVGKKPGAKKLAGDAVEGK